MYVDVNIDVYVKKRAEFDMHRCHCLCMPPCYQDWKNTTACGNYLFIILAIITVIHHHILHIIKTWGLCYPFKLHLKLGLVTLIEAELHFASLGPLVPLKGNSLMLQHIKVFVVV